MKSTLLEINEQVYLDEILGLQKEVERLRQDNVKLLSVLRRFLDKELKSKKMKEKKQQL